jgi:hypothetical protein
VVRRAPAWSSRSVLLAWKHPGFSADVGERIALTDKLRLEDAAAHLVRNPLWLRKLVYLDWQQAVLYRSRMNPSLGRNFGTMDPLEWLARLIARVYQVDPLVCVRCGQRVRLIAFVTDQMAIGKILEHLGLSTPEVAKPPLPAREVLRVAEHGDGWGVPAQWE